MSHEPRPITRAEICANYDYDKAWETADAEQHAEEERAQLLRQRTAELDAEDRARVNRVAELHAPSPDAGFWHGVLSAFALTAVLALALVGLYGIIMHLAGRL